MANTFDLTWTNDAAFLTLDSQQIESAAGEDIAFAFTLDEGTVNVSAWAIQFDAAPSSGRNPVVTVASGSITKGSTGNISFTVPKASTQDFPTRSFYWELIRTDAGNRKVLAFGDWAIAGSPSLYPGVVIGPTIIPLNKGGTGSDLSASGPGVLIQAAALANVTTLTADLANTTLYLRKDLTWQLPAGSVPGTVTDVSVVTANGVSGSVANATTTPAITITLGAITPTSIAASGTVSGSNLSGTNTGDQTNISGNAATVSVIDASADTTTWPMLATAQTGNLSPATDAGITYDAATNTLTLGVAGASIGSLVLSGNTSGYVQINTAAAAGSWTLTLPANNGDSGQFLQTDGNGVTSWATASTTATAITVANEASDATCFLGFFTAATGDLGPKTNAALTFNSATANLGCTTFTGALVGNASTATTLATSRTLWGQAFTGAANVTGSLTSVGDITGGASSMTILAGTGASRTLTFQTTTAGGTATNTLILNANQTSSFASHILPVTNDTTQIGSTSLGIADYFAASGHVTNYNDGNVTVTHSSEALTFSKAILKDFGTSPWYSDGATVKAVDNGRQFLQLAYDSGIRGIGSDGTTSYHLLRIADVPGISPTANFGILGDQRLDWISVGCMIDMIGNDIVDVVNIGNVAGLYSPRLMQRYADSAYNVGVATGNASGVLTDRLVFSNHVDTATATFSNVNVGVNTPSPISKLSVLGDAVANWYNSGLTILQSDYSTNGGRISIYKLTGANTAAVFQSGDNSNYQAIQLNPFGGNVGVGVSPSYKLDVATSAANDRGVNVAVTSTSGTVYGVNVGVGGAATTNIGVHLDVSGATNNRALSIAGPAFAGNAYAIYSPATATSYLAGRLGLGVVAASYVLDIATAAANDRGINVAVTSTSGTVVGTYLSVTGAATENIGLFVTASGATLNYGVRIAAPNAGANNFALYSSGTAQSYFAGKVGHNIAAPVGQSHVKSSSTSTVTQIIELSTGTQTANALEVNSNGGSGGDLARFTAAGKLVVGSNSTTPTAQIVAHGANSTVDGQIAAYSTETATTANIGGTLVVGGNYNGAGSQTAYGVIGGKKENSSAGDFAGYLAFYTRPNGGSFAQAMRISSAGQVSLTQPVQTSGSPTALTVTGGAHTTLAASTEAIDVNVNLTRTVQFATGALTTQRAAVFQAPTYGFVGASTLTTAATVAITGAPVAGTNATITNALALWVQAGAARFDGTIELGHATDTTLARSAAGKIAVEGKAVPLMSGAVDAVFAGPTSARTYTFPDTDGTIVDLASAQVVTNKTMIATTNVVEEITTTASSATPTPTGGSLKNYFTVTALAADATFAAPSGSPVDGNRLLIRIKDNGTARLLSFNAIYRALGVTLPTTTVISKTLYLGAVYNGQSSKWDVLAVGVEA